MLFLEGGNSDCKLQLQIRAAYQHQKKKKRRVRTAFAAILVLFALVTGYFLRMEKTQVARAEETITVTEIVNE